MEKERKTEDQFNNYGTLITVASLLLIVVYSTESYDAWDSLISLIGMFYGISYLWMHVYFDWASRLLGALIGSTGLVLLIGSVYSIYIFYKTDGLKTKTELSVCEVSLYESINQSGGVNPMLICIIVLTILLYLIAGKANV